MTISLYDEYMVNSRHACYVFCPASFETFRIAIFQLNQHLVRIRVSGMCSRTMVRKTKHQATGLRWVAAKPMKLPSGKTTTIRLNLVSTIKAKIC